MIRAVRPAYLRRNWIRAGPLLILGLLCATSIASFAEESCPAQCDASRLSGEVSVRDAQLAIDGHKVFRAGTKWLDNEIFVCWENATPENEKERGWVKEAVESTWQKHSGLKFTGWEACAPNSWGIRILIADEGPHTKGVGRQIAWNEDGTEKDAGMVLNFTFANWAPACAAKREQCIKAIAIHEFGHALGFMHEVATNDVPGECGKPQPQSGTSDKPAPLTPWDSCSVMNYCAPDDLRAELSPCDILLLQRIYPPP